MEEQPKEEPKKEEPKQEEAPAEPQTEENTGDAATEQPKEEGGQPEENPASILANLINMGRVEQEEYYNATAQLIKANTKKVSLNIWCAVGMATCMIVAAIIIL